MAKRRPSGDGMVRKRDDGRWEGRIVVGHKDDGSPIFRYVYGSTQKELTAKLRKCITAYQGVELTEQSKITMSEWLDQWLIMTEETVRPGTMKGYRSYVENHIRPVPGEKRIAQITAKDIQKLYDKLGQKLASGTVRRVHTTLHSIMKTSKQMHIIPKNPVEEVIPPKFSYQQKNVLTDEQLERFMEEHDDVKLIIIDTLQKVREEGGDGYSYSNDYQIIGRLKSFADSYGICVLIVHHTRKEKAEDIFEMISGTTGLFGAADGAFVMQKEKRTSNSATLEIVGRDQPDQRFKLVRNIETLAWELESSETELWNEPKEPLLFGL